MWVGGWRGKGYGSYAHSLPGIADPYVAHGLGGEISVLVYHRMWEVTFFGFIFVLALRSVG